MKARMNEQQKWLFGPIVEVTLRRFPFERDGINAGRPCRTTSQSHRQRTYRDVGASKLIHTSLTQFFISSNLA